MTTTIRSLYYAGWANLSVFPMTVRAAVVLGTIVVLIWVIARPLFFKFLLLLLWLAGVFVKLICLLGGKLLGITARKSPEQYAVRYNRLADLMGRCNERLLKWRERLSGKHKFRLGQMLLFYGALMLLVALPNLLEPVVSEEYLPYFSAASDLYQRIEAPALRTSAAYSPLFFSKHETPEQKAVLEEEPNSEVWLPLSERGQNGSNLRGGPGKNNPVLDTLNGDTQVLYLGEQSGRWVHVRTEEGTEGWIHDSLVTGVPEGAAE